MTPIEKIQHALEELGLATGKVKPETVLRSLVTDSLELANVILELEDAFDIEIPDEEAQQLFTVGDVVRYAEAH